MAADLVEKLVFIKTTMDHRKYVLKDKSVRKLQLENSWTFQQTISQMD